MSMNNKDKEIEYQQALNTYGRCTQNHQSVTSGRPLALFLLTYKHSTGWVSTRLCTYHLGKVIKEAFTIMEDVNSMTVELLVKDRKVLRRQK